MVKLTGNDFGEMNKIGVRVWLMRIKKGKESVRKRKEWGYIY